ncbi:MAG: flagellar hook-length control protein FliK [Alphaproteobacteria bacterium]|nr:flagellar hook-length control protein FliK [Alphaproteobacteria bacterium]
MPAPLAEAAVAAQPADITEPDANAPAAPAVSAAAKPLAVIPAVLTLPPADPIMASTAVRSNDTGAEPADAAPAPAAAPPQPAKPAADRGRAGRGTAAEPDSDKDAAVIDPAAPAGTAPLDPVLQPASTAPLSHADSPPSAIHPTHVNDSHAPPPATAPRNDAPQQTAQEPTQATTSQEQTPAAPSAETPPATPDAPAARRAAEASPDPIKAAIPAVHDAVSTEAVARAIAETSQPAAAPAGRTAQAAQSSAEPTRSEIPSPAQQIAAPLVALGTGPDQSRRMTVRLDPAALGAVQVRVDRPKEGPARVEITVERPETLSLLLRDQPQLQRALDQAGIPSEGRNVVLQIAAPDPQPRNDAPIPDHRQSDAGQPATGDSGARSEGYGGGGEGGGSGRGRRGGADEDGPVYRFTPSAAQRRLRDGLDITA